MPKLCRCDDKPLDGPRTRAISEHVAVTGDGPAEVARRTLTSVEVTSLLEREIASMQSAAAELRARGAGLRADELEAQAEIARTYV
ncbi:MAG: hypothetical protein ABL871_04095 [Terricaulis sp.]